MFPIWIYAAMAVLIASVAFLVGQWQPGLGVAVAAGGSTLWTAYAVYRGARRPR